MFFFVLFFILKYFFCKLFFFYYNTYSLIRKPNNNEPIKVCFELILICFFLYFILKLFFLFVCYFNSNLNCFFCSQLCKTQGGTCLTRIDGFYIETLVCIVIGFLWLQWGRPTINRLQRLPPSAWQIARYNR